MQNIIGLPTRYEEAPKLLGVGKCTREESPLIAVACWTRSDFPTSRMLVKRMKSSGNATYWTFIFFCDLGALWECMLKFMVDDEVLLVAQFP